MPSFGSLVGGHWGDCESFGGLFGWVFGGNLVVVWVK